MALILVLFVTAALIVIACIAIVNVLTMPRLKALTLNPSPSGRGTVPPFALRAKGREDEGNTIPSVSILIPARNEAAVIGATVRALLAQTRTDFELFVLDDHSDDGTAEVVIAAGNGDPRLRALPGQPLPPGWLGKNWACHQLAAAARGDILVFADADVKWQPDALAALIDQMERNDADLQTVWPTQTTITPAERLCVPLMALVVLGYLPWLLAHYTPWSAFAAANGQCMAWRRRAYDCVGGHAAVRDNVLEDVTLARLTKRAGLRLRMADGAGLIGCRMYDGWRAVRDGYAKNILAGYGNSVLALGLATVFHWLTFVLPWVWLVSPPLRSSPSQWGGVGEGTFWALIALGVGVRALTAAATHQRPADALLLPLSVVLMTRIAAQAIWWRWRYGGPRWKGRTLGRPDSSQSQEIFTLENAHDR